MVLSIAFFDALMELDKETRKCFMVIFLDNFLRIAAPMEFATLKAFATDYKRAQSHVPLPEKTDEERENAWAEFARGIPQ